MGRRKKIQESAAKEVWKTVYMRNVQRMCRRPVRDAAVIGRAPDVINRMRVRTEDEDVISPRPLTEHKNDFDSFHLSKLAQRVDSADIPKIDSST